MGKYGRPKKAEEDKRLRVVKVAFTKKEFQQLEKLLTESVAQSYSAYIRKTVLTKTPPVTKELAAVHGQLGRIGGNINQIARVTNQNEALDMETYKRFQQELEHLKSELYNLRITILK